MIGGKSRKFESTMLATTGIYGEYHDPTGNERYYGEMQEPRDGYEAVRTNYPPLLNTAQVAELLDLNTRTVLAMANDGRLPASRLADSRKFHFLLEEIITTLKNNRVVPSEESLNP